MPEKERNVNWNPCALTLCPSPCMVKVYELMASPPFLSGSFGGRSAALVG